MQPKKINQNKTIRTMKPPARTRRTQCNKPKKNTAKQETTMMTTERAITVKQQQ